MLGTGLEDAQEAGAGSEKGRKDVYDLTDCFCVSVLAPRSNWF